MAPSAIEAELAVVYIVGLVTIVTPIAELELCLKRLAMTRFAIHIVVRTVQQERGLPVVIEAPFRPVDWRMANSTVAGESVPVAVVRCMARQTVGWRVTKSLSFVTGQAVGVAVFAQQRKARQTVIEEDVLGPRGFIVAVFAGDSLGTLVRIVFLVAVAACCWRLSVKQRFDVTTCAFNIGVCANEGMRSVDIVIKRKLCPLVGNVACVTALPKVPIMIVVVLMA